MTMTELPQPVPPSTLVRLLVVVIVVLAFVAGYYHSAWQVERQKYDALVQESQQSLPSTNVEGTR